MNKIAVAILDEYKIALEGICALLADTDNIEITLKISDKDKLIPEIITTNINILIFNVHQLSANDLELIRKISAQYPGIKILIISFLPKEEIVYKIIKAGAKGFLSNDSDKRELIQAIYTLRNGFEYFSNSITDILLNKYIDILKSDKNEENKNINNLSARELEVLKFWGESYTNKEIADKLFISVRTVESHKNHIMQRLNLKTTVDLVKYAIKNNIIDI